MYANMLDEEVYDLCIKIELDQKLTLEEKISEYHLIAYAQAWGADGDYILIFSGDTVICDWYHKILKSPFIRMYTLYDPESYDLPKIIIITTCLEVSKSR